MYLTRLLGCSSVFHTCSSMWGVGAQLMVVSFPLPNSRACAVPLQVRTKAECPTTQSQ